MSASLADASAEARSSVEERAGARARAPSTSASPASRARILALFAGVNRFGAEHANLEVLCALRDRGAEVLVVLGDAPWAQDIRDLVANLGLEHAPLPRLDITGAGRGKWGAALVTMLHASLRLASLERRFKPTHFHTFSQLSVLNFLPALALSRTPVVYRCGDRPILHNAVWRLVWRFLVARARRFVANSRYVSSQLQAAGVEESRITLIYNRPFARPEEDCGDAPDDIEEGFNILYVGQLIENKGPHLLIDAFARVRRDFPHARLLVVGRISDWKGDDWARELRRRTLGDEALAGAVRFLGFIEDVPSLMARCSVCVTPTLTEEPLANVVLEAKSCSVPSIVFRSGGLPEVIEHGVDGYLCEEKSVDALEAALRAYLSDPERCAREGRAAKASLDRLAVGEFSERWSKVFETC